MIEERVVNFSEIQKVGYEKVRDSEEDIRAMRKRRLKKKGISMWLWADDLEQIRESAYDMRITPEELIRLIIGEWLLNKRGYVIAVNVERLFYDITGG